MNEVTLLKIAVGALVTVVSVLAGVIVKLYRKLEERTDQLIDLSLRVKNGDSEVFQKICEILDKYRSKKKTKGSSI